MTRARWAIAASLLGALIVAGMFVLLGGGLDSEPARRVSLRPSATMPAAFSQPADKLRIAVGAIISPTKTLVFYEEIFDYVGEKLGRDVVMVQRKTYAEVNFLMEQGSIDAAFVCSRPYVDGHRDFGMELLCVPVCSGRTEYYSYFIVHKDSPIRKLEDLRGKVFAFSDRLSNTGMLVPTYTLARMGETPESFFGNTTFTYSHDNSIRSVAERFVDGAAVDSLIWEYFNAKEPEWTSQTRIIHKSPPFAIPPVVVSPRTDPELKEALRRVFLSMHQDPKGRAILQKVLIDRFAAIKDSAYDAIRRMETFTKEFRPRM